MAAEMMRVLTAKLGFSSVVELIGHAEGSGEEFVSSDGSLLHMLSTCHVVSRVFEVVIGGTRMESGFCHSCWDSHGVQILSFRLPLWSPQFGRVCCILSCVWLSGCVTTWGGETGSPPLKSCGDFCVSRGFFGGRGIAHPPS